MSTGIAFFTSLSTDCMADLIPPMKSDSFSKVIDKMKCVVVELLQIECTASQPAVPAKSKRQTLCISLGVYTSYTLYYCLSILLCVD
jgi:hypothetical protein